MATVQFVETINGPLLPYGADILDIDFSGTSLTAFAGNNGSARLVSFDISGTASFSGQTFLGAGTDGFVAANYGSVTLNLSNTRVDDVLNVTPGQMQDANSLTGLNTGQAADAVALVGVNMGADTYLVSSLPATAGLQVFQVQTNGSLSAVTPPPAAGIGQVSDLATVTAYGQTWVLATSLTNESVQSYTIDATGALTYQFSFGAADGLGINTPVNLNPVMLEGQPYIVLASADSNSLSVLRLEADGSFTAVDHVLDDLNSRFAEPTVLQTTTVGDHVFVLAAGSDDGFSLFQLRPDGRLHLLATVADTTALPLDNVSAAAMGLDGTDLRLFLASSTEVGMASFTYDLSNLGANIGGTSGDDMLTGTALDDTILGGAGDDTLSGGAGADILVDGAGSDILIGGPGADVFTFDPDGVNDTIQDFERGVDALDLSFFPLLYDPNDLGFVATYFGATLTFQGESIDIYSSDFNPLTLAELSAINPFNLDRPALVLGGGSSGGGQTQIGTAADDTLVGTGLDDILSGNGGDDMLIGGAGADALFGGSGSDTAGYATAAGGVTIDLQNGALNTGDAAGDTLTSIEIISGTGFADQISGSAGADTLLGQNGADTLTGRGGDDVLNGGAGNDILNGGAGADTLIGGSQTDTASYIDAISGARIDLAYQDRNTGQAAGDSFNSIENLTGSDLGDLIYGDGGNNTIYGLDGDDWLQGRGGNDTLIGGAGNDVLVGGVGADVLNGGTGTDRAQYFLSKQGLTVDLGNSSNNTGIAAGDTFISIEDLAGSPYDDILTGDGGANMLIGNGGDDRLDGTGGDDVLRGGAGADTFVFSAGSGSDSIADYDAADLIELDIALLGATAQNSAAVLNDYASLINGAVQLDFGGGDILIIDNISSLTDLDNAFTFA